MNYQETLRKADINISASGDNIVISPGLAGSGMPAAWDNPAQYIAIDFISFIPSGTVTIQLVDGAAIDANVISAASPQVNYGGPLPVISGQPLTWENATKNEHGVITLKPNHSFVINLNGAVQVGGFIRYRLLSGN